MKANDSVTPYEQFYGVKLDVSHIRTFGCTVCVTLPCKKLGKLENQGEMGYLLGYKYEGGYRVLDALHWCEGSQGCCVL